MSALPGAGGPRVSPGPEPAVGGTEGRERRVGRLQREILEYSDRIRELAQAQEAERVGRRVEALRRRRLHRHGSGF